MFVPVAVRLIASCYTSLLYFSDLPLLSLLVYCLSTIVPRSEHSHNAHKCGINVTLGVYGIHCYKLCTKKLLTVYHILYKLKL